jgi:signal transduction histidine kinase/CheY-like chemotaxis protein
LFVYGLTLLSLLAGLWWWRERRLGWQRRVLRGIVRLSENLLDAQSPREILSRVQKQTPDLLDVSRTELYLYEAGEDVLQRVPASEGETVLRISVDEPVGSLGAAAALCFRNRALLRIPDLLKSPIVQEREERHRTAVFVPMLTQGGPVGVLAVYLVRRLWLPVPDQDVALQHLANQIAAALKLQEQRAIREQLFRTEKMAAAGQLISAVANDLRGPLEAIGQKARELSPALPDEAALSDVAREAERGLGIIRHLLSFASMEQGEAAAAVIDIHGLASGLLELRRAENHRKGIIIENQLPVSPVSVLADQSQLEQAMLTVLVEAELAALSSCDKTLRATGRILGRRVLVLLDVGRPAMSEDPPPPREGTGFPVAQAIIQSYGGELRAISDARHGTRFEMELPLHDPVTPPADPATPHEKPTRTLTCLLVEPDTNSQRKLLTGLSERGHRGIPATSAEHAADLVQRMRFDVVFCSSSLPGSNWLELYRRIRRRIGAFALLADVYDPETARIFDRGEGRVLVRPVEDRELGEFLSVLGGAHETTPR